MFFDTAAIPIEIWQSYIFKYLDLFDLCIIREVCRNLRLTVNQFDGHSLSNVWVSTVQRLDYVKKYIPLASIKLSEKLYRLDVDIRNTNSMYTALTYKHILDAISTLRMSDLYISSHNITQEDLTKIKSKLRSMHLFYCSFIYVLDNTVPTISSLVIDNCTNLTTISNFSNLRYLKIDGRNNIKNLTELPKLHTLILFDRYINMYYRIPNTIKLSYLPNLQKLHLQDVYVTEIKDIPTLTYLNISVKSDIHIPIINCDNIKYLYINQSCVNYPDLILPHLVLLSICSRNCQNISSLLHAESLETIELHNYHNNSTEHAYSISDLPNLHTLSIRYDNIVTISNNPLLKKLNIIGSNIGTITILSQLYSISIQGSKIGSILFNPTSNITPDTPDTTDYIIRYMEISSNSISNICFRELININEFRWNRNKGGKYNLSKIKVLQSINYEDPYRCVKHKPDDSEYIVSILYPILPWSYSIKWHQTKKCYRELKATIKRRLCL